MIVYDVYTDLDPDQLTEVAKETFRIWLSFALGQSSEIGKKLIAPTGKYAAALSWKQTGVSRVSIIADERIAPEASWIETGTDEADMTQMLREKFKVGADGRRYRVVPLRPDVPEGAMHFNFRRIAKSAGGGESIPTGVGQIWAQARDYVDPKSRFRTISEDTDGWIVPPMTAYAPAHALKDLLERKYGGRSLDYGGSVDEYE